MSPRLLLEIQLLHVIRISHHSKLPTAWLLHSNLDLSSTWLYNLAITTSSSPKATQREDDMNFSQTFPHTFNMASNGWDWKPSITHLNDLTAITHHKESILSTHRDKLCPLHYFLEIMCCTLPTACHFGQCVSTSLIKLATTTSPSPERTKRDDVTKFSKNIPYTITLARMQCNSKPITHHRKSTSYYIPTTLRPANIACWNPATTCDWATNQCTSPTDCSIQLNIFSSNRTLILLLLSLLVNFTPENRSHHNFTASTRWHA